MKKHILGIIMFFALCGFCMLCASCNPKSYKAAKYSIYVAAEVAEEAGVFGEKMIRIPLRIWGGDTLFFYDGGVNLYYIRKDTSDQSIKINFIFRKEPTRDTLIRWINHLEKIQLKKDSLKNQ